MSEIHAYGAYPIKPKRSRRTKAEMTTLRDAIFALARDNQPATVRQLFYLAVTEGLIPKTEAAYQKTVCRLVLLMRREGRIPYSWIADHTRWMRKPKTWSSLDEMLETAASSYRRALWDEQDSYVEVWSEKNTLAGILFDVTKEFDVPLMVTTGFSSETFLYQAALAI